MPRVVSFLVLLAIILILGSIFFQVMAGFLVPMFLACVLVVMFRPLHGWILERMGGYTRLAALLTTFLIMLVVLLPAVWLSWNAYIESSNVYQLLQEEEAGGANPLTKLTERAKDLTDILQEKTSISIDPDAKLKEAVDWIGDKLPLVAGGALRILVGLAIMVLSLYYFLADGPAMIQTIMRLSPLEPKYERELLDRFVGVSRGVVVATLLSAVVQGITAGIGFYFALPSTAPIFLLVAGTMVMAIVPFVGAAGVWIPTCLWIYLYGERIVEGETLHDGNWVTAAILAVYCTLVVSSLDNVIKPLVLHGQSNLHPLLALLSILGGLTALGPIGLLVGPMLVSFLQALLNMLHKELEGFNQAAKAEAKPPPRKAGK